MKLSTLLFREKTQAVVKQTVTFNAPGTYYPPYGKTAFLLQGQGQPGNYSSGGNYAGTNPPSGGNYAGTNAGSGGNIAGYNTNYGNYAGVNGGVTTTYYDSAVPGSYSTSTIYGSDVNCPSSYSTTVGNTYYNASFFCTPYYNPTIPGNPNYNPYVPGNDYYNPYVPGNAYYNPYVPGNAGSNYNVLGVPLPGGAADSAAQVVGYVPVTIDYTTSGISVSCPPGGYVKIQNL